ncbi:MAG: hypothetical protein JWQ65_819 [Devosia sp.]|nr:hypothetical protein [Devosia sp.]
MERHPNISLPESPVGEPVNLAFGPFRLFPSRQLLLRDGHPVRLGHRAFAILRMLTENAGEIVKKEDLLRTVWPDTTVEEANLRVNVAALRKSLGDNGSPEAYIANIVGRGYQFVAPVTVDVGNVTFHATSIPVQARFRFSPLARIIGRDSTATALTERLLLRRFVTVVGPGGIGKTTVASMVADKIGESFANGVAMADLSASVDPFATLAGILKLALHASDPLSSLIDFLRDKHVLLVLDSCEHLLNDTAVLAERLLREAPEVHLLATSTEPMRAEGEWIYRLPPLEVPAEAENLNAAQALESPAIELFVDRASASSETFIFEDSDVPLVAEICRRLDGNPLAIEIAAARVDVFNLNELNSLIDDRFELLTTGRRTAAPRHRTLRGLLDWSYDHLPQQSQIVLRRLSVFRGYFSLDGARTVAGLGTLQNTAVADVADLVRKSLIFAATTPAPAYRLLDSTRAYAHEKAVLAGEQAVLQAVHARYVEALLRKAEADWVSTPRNQWLETYGSSIDDVRSAIEWASSDDANMALAVRLTALALPLGLHLGIVDEFRSRVERAIEAAAELPKSEVLAEIRLNVAIGTFAMNQNPVLTKHMGMDRALAVAEATGDPLLRAEPLIQKATYEFARGHYVTALKEADEGSSLVAPTGDDLAVLGTNRVLAQAAGMAGNNRRAIAIAIDVLGHPAVNIPFAWGPMAVNRNISMRIVIARNQWQMGRFESASAVAEEAVDYARRESPFDLAQAFALAAVPIALWNGDLEQARALNSELLDQAKRYTLDHWHSWGEVYERILAKRSGGIGAVPTANGILQADTLGTLDADILLPGVFERAKAGEAGWCASEILRVGALLTRSEHTELLLQDAMSIAVRQEALAWQLRIATSMAKTAIVEGRSREGLAVLEPILSQIDDGADTADVRAAKALLDQSP